MMIIAEIRTFNSYKKSSNISSYEEHVHDEFQNEQNGIESFYQLSLTLMAQLLGKRAANNGNIGNIDD